LNAYMREYGRKLFSALHYKEFGKIIPKEGGILWRWYSYEQRMDDQMPDQLTALMKESHVIQGAKRDLSDQFSYSFVKAEDSELTCYFAAFRRSFAMVATVEVRQSSPHALHASLGNQAIVDILQPLGHGHIAV
jgi:hypothetical protein